MDWPTIESPTDVEAAFDRLPAVVAYVDALLTEARATYAAPGTRVPNGVILEGTIYADPAWFLVRLRSELGAVMGTRKAEPRHDLIDGHWPYRDHGHIDPYEPSAVQMQAKDAAWAWWATQNAITLLKDRRAAGLGNPRSQLRTLTDHATNVLFPDLIEWCWQSGTPFERLHYDFDPQVTRRPVGTAYVSAVAAHEAALTDAPPPNPPNQPKKGPSWH